MAYAETSLQNEISRIDENESRSVVFIVGMGNHSEGGIRKIKPALETMITEKYGFKIVDEIPHPGCLSVEFSVKGKMN